MRPPASLDTRLYHAAQYLYPPAFRREFSEEIVRVFDEARQDAQAASPPRGIWAFRARMSADLARTVVWQWLRTGWPLIAAMAALFPLTAGSAIAGLWRRSAFVLPRGTANDDVLMLFVLAVVAILIICTTIILTLWFTRPLLYRRRT